MLCENVAQHWWLEHIVDDQELLAQLILYIFLEILQFVLILQALNNIKQLIKLGKNEIAILGNVGMKKKLEIATKNTMKKLLL